MKELLKRTLPTAWRRRLRRLGRLRWMTKYGLLKAYDFKPWSDPFLAARFVLWDPEVESHSYELENEQDLVTFLANLLKVNDSLVSGYLSEAKSDPVLLRDRGFRLSIKRRTPLGRRTAWYLITRITKPRLVVETGIHDGLGSETVLRALQRNAEEGSEGQLISFDIYADTGWAIAPSLKVRWRQVIGSTFDALEPALRGRQVDFFIRDTPPSERNVRFELGIALRHAADKLIVVDSAGEGAIVLREICGRLGGTCDVFVDLPRRHVLRANPHAYARFERVVTLVPTKNTTNEKKALGSPDSGDEHSLHANDGATSFG